MNYSDLRVDLKYLLNCLTMLVQSKTPERRNYWRHAIIREAEAIIEKIDASWEEE